MAQKVTVMLVDDIEGGKAEETIDFSLDGVSYQIDLNAGNAERLRGAFTEFLEAARRTGGRNKRNAAARGEAVDYRDSSGRLNRMDRDAIRAWAEQNDLVVAERGRIASSVIEGWREAGSPRPQ